MTQYMSILVDFRLNVLPFLFLFLLLIHLFLCPHLFAVVLYPEFDPSLLSPRPHSHPQHDLDRFSSIDRIASNSFLVGFSLCLFPFCFVLFLILHYPAFPGKCPSQNSIVFSIFSLLVLSFLHFAPGFLKVCLRIHVMSLFIPITNTSFIVLNTWCLSADGELVSPLKTLVSPLKTLY